MTALINQRITLIMALLFAVTFISWRLGIMAEGKIGTSLIILIAAFKIRYVMLDFMAVRAAPFILRLYCNVWIAAVAGIIIALQWLAPGNAA